DEFSPSDEAGSPSEP
ncbi:hypothetical protein A2U01_0118664, partial [Trifolium medium]|nr:hypothetical protein [Trifolium medium]